jgi:hypothetical protein
VEGEFLGSFEREGDIFVSPEVGEDILGWLAIGKSERGRKAVERRKWHEKCLDIASIIPLL